MNISIMVCTRNRAESLGRTVNAIGKCKVPAGARVELLVVDNGSTDNTAALLKQIQLSNMELRSVYEAKAGLSNARNRALSESSGDYLLFTDDDVQPGSTWIVDMLAPMIAGRAEAVQGAVTPAPELKAERFGAFRGPVLAAVSRTANVEELTGASMGFDRKVLQRVPGFDGELGAGALGYGEDKLFSLQLKEAGFRLAFADGAEVLHYPDPSRLFFRDVIGVARRLGRSMAYIEHHWEHGIMLSPRASCLWNRTKSMVRSFPWLSDDSAVPPIWRLCYEMREAQARQYLNEVKRPRRYELRGLAPLKEGDKQA